MHDRSPPPPAPPSTVVMGVAGCGKSSLAAALAQALGVAWVEGDDDHSPANRAKMAGGTPLTDADRAEWLAALADRLRAAHASGSAVVLTCSALKRDYRERLRAASPGLRFAFLDIDRATALSRVAGRGNHFFSATLVDSQFATLERPDGEAGVLRLDATAPPLQLLAQLQPWLLAPA